MLSESRRFVRKAGLESGVDGQSLLNCSHLVTWIIGTTTASANTNDCFSEGRPPDSSLEAEFLTARSNRKEHRRCSVVFRPGLSSAARVDFRPPAFPVSCCQQRRLLVQVAWGPAFSHEASERYVTYLNAILVTDYIQRAAVELGLSVLEPVPPSPKVGPILRSQSACYDARRQSPGGIRGNQAAS